MSSFNQDMVNGYEDIARSIQGSDLKNMTKEELLKLLEEIRTDCWYLYNQGADYLGWGK